jgi:hypothetical protein
MALRTSGSCRILPRASWGEVIPTASKAGICVLSRAGSPADGMMLTTPSSNSQRLGRVGSNQLVHQITDLLADTAKYLLGRVVLAAEHACYACGYASRAERCLKCVPSREEVNSGTGNLTFQRIARSLLRSLSPDIRKAFPRGDCKQENGGKYSPRMSFCWASLDCLKSGPPSGTVASRAAARYICRVSTSQCSRI